MVFASVALALLDFVGVAALVPVLLLILSEDATFSYPVMRWLYEAGSFTSFGTFVTAVCVAVLLVIIVKSILTDRKSTRLNSSHYQQSRMPSSA